MQDLFDSVKSKASSTSASQQPPAARASTASYQAIGEGL
jgi:hypothetical protein